MTSDQHVTRPEFANSPIGGRFEAKMAQRARGLLTFIFVIMAFCGAIAFPTQSAFGQLSSPALPAAPPELEARLKKLETELRCLVCQNQTLADSPANLAGDLRREIRALADQGKSNEDIKEFLKVRYGDFILYKPPVGSRTYLLWFGPFVLLLLGVGLLARMARRRSAVPAAPTSSVDSAAQARARQLLDET